MKARRVKRLDPAAAARGERARASVSVARRDALVRPAALDPANSVAQHDMRIAAKRLRYILEATGFCFGKPAQTAGRRARDLQGTARGSVPRLRRDAAARSTTHIADCAPRMRRPCARRRATHRPSTRRSRPARRHRTAYRGLEVLTVYVQAQRELRLRSLPRLLERAGGGWHLGPAGARGHARRPARDQGTPRAEERIEQARHELEEAEREERAAAERARQAAAELAAGHAGPRTRRRRPQGCSEAV